MRWICPTPSPNRSVMPRQACRRRPSRPKTLTASTAGPGWTGWGRSWPNWTKTPTSAGRRSRASRPSTSSSGSRSSRRWRSIARRRASGRSSAYWAARAIRPSSRPHGWPCPRMRSPRSRTGRTARLRGYRVGSHLSRSRRACPPCRSSEDRPILPTRRDVRSAGSRGRSSRRSTERDRVRSSSRSGTEAIDGPRPSGATCAAGSSTWSAKSRSSIRPQAAWLTNGSAGPMGTTPRMCPNWPWDCSAGASGSAARHSPPGSGPGSMDCSGRAVYPPGCRSS